MKRELNFTNRRRINHSDVDIRLKAEAAGPALELRALGFDKLALPDDCTVVVDVRRPASTTAVRWHLGDLKDLQLPLTKDLPAFFGDAADVLCRVKAVGTGEAQGRLLAAADKIRPTQGEGEGGSTPLLRFTEDGSLGQILWRLTLEDEPVVHVNAGLEDWRQFIRQPLFRALVLPEVLRQIVPWVLDQEDSLDADDASEDVAGRWRAFFASIGRPVTEAPTGDEEREDWIDGLVSDFARRHHLLDAVQTQEGSVA